MGGTKTKDVGGGPAIGLGQDITSLLSGSLFGNFGGQPTAGQRFAGANPTGGVQAFLMDILGQGAGKIGGALGEMIARENTRNIGDLRGRFGAGGGQAFGTPAAFAESQYRAEAAPRAATAIGGLQLQTILPLLQLSGALGSRGISQRQTIAMPSGFSSFLSTLAPIAGAIAGGPVGAAIGGGVSSLFRGGSSPAGGAGMTDPLAPWNNQPLYEDPLGNR